MRNATLLTGFVICLCLTAAAQKNQFSMDAGIKITPSVGNNSDPNGVTSISSKFAFEVNYARRIKKLPSAALQLEFPYVFALQAQTKSLNLFTASGYRSMFFTPSLKFQILPDNRVSPWVSFGAGMGHFTTSKTNLAGAATPALATTNLAYQAGGGLDFRVRKITFRMEGRELYSGTPNLGVSGTKIHHNILIAGGVVFNF